MKPFPQKPTGRLDTDQGGSKPMFEKLYPLSSDLIRGKNAPAFSPVQADPIALHLQGGFSPDKAPQ
jgi:hypothetical protein